MDKFCTAVVIIPTLNEASTIMDTIGDVIQHNPRCGIIVVDSYSTNGTAEKARASGAEVMNAPRGGKGVAVRHAISELHDNIDFKYLIMIDGDATYPAEYIPDIVSRLQNGADVVMGYRKVIEDGAMSPVNKFGNKVLSLLASMLYGKWVFDVCTGMWGFRKEVIDGFRLTSKGFTFEADLFANAVEAGCKIKQIPISYRARPCGSMAKLKVSDGFKIGWFLIKRRFVC